MKKDARSKRFADVERFRFLASVTAKEGEEIYDCQFVFCQEGRGGDLAGLRYAVDITMRASREKEGSK